MSGGISFSLVYWLDSISTTSHVFAEMGRFTTIRAPSALHEPLPAIEGARLLLNRGAGLLWAMRVVQGHESPPDVDFVRRNYWKCALALGDALLIAHQRYSTPYSGRDEAFSQLVGC